MAGETEAGPHRRLSYEEFARTLMEKLGPYRALYAIERILSRGCAEVRGELWCVDPDTLEFYRPGPGEPPPVGADTWDLRGGRGSN